MCVCLCFFVQEVIYIYVCVNSRSFFDYRLTFFSFSPGSCTGTDPADLKELEQDVANFLLIRGPYAYLV